MVDNGQIKSCLVDIGLIGEDDSVSPDESLFDRGSMDSLGIMSLVMELTSRYKIRVPDEDLLPDNFDSITSIAHYVNAKLSTATYGRA